ncbi:MAG: DUF1574 domain-containing protein [Coleofasciculus sp. G3-WIS-01]|uniref:DUF1574 domain-containing protein n=1 Tax=Coleofasciculus sp. G3-WIS-01 TaxID=3069528 RepID=UPI0032FE1DDD
MLDVEERNYNNRPSSLAQWVYDAIGQPGVCLRVRLRGNNLHILCESRESIPAQRVVNQLLQALKPETATFPVDLESPIYQIIIYGRKVSQAHPEWVKEIRLNTDTNNTESVPEPSWETTPAQSAFIISHESLARSGSPDAIARYLSANLSHLGVSVNIQIQDLPIKDNREQSLVKQKPKIPSQSSPPYHRRLWVICTSNYSPDSALLSEPIVKLLRSLELTEFRDAAISAQVRGEATPEWMVRVDLTPTDVMLKDWARWGDVQAIATLSNQMLAQVGMTVRAVLKETTLHLFCSALDLGKTPVPDQATAMNAIAPLLKSLKPQGIKAATIYGVESDYFSLEPELEKPVWVDWVTLPASEQPQLASSSYSLGQQGNLNALTFLLQRLLNPDLDERLATGGIQIKVRRQQDLLHIMSEAPLCPSKAQVSLPIVRFVRQLAISTIAGVRIYGRSAGATSPAWNYGVDFAERRRLALETTPEFVTSDTDISELVVPTEESVSRPHRTDTTLKEGLPRQSNTAVGTIGRWLCSSQLFVPTPDNQRVAVDTQRTSSESSQAVKVALVWGIMGLLLMFLFDRPVGRILQPQGNFSQRDAVSAAQESPIPVDLSQLSLQQDNNQNSQDFNASGFTRAGDKSIIIDDSLPSQRKDATQAAMLALARSSNPPFNNQLLDQKLALYQERLQQGNRPDVLIMGSSRAMRGIDPVALEEALAVEGYSDIDVFNFGINGATAQIVDLMTRRILTPDQLPKLIIVADGARAFNSGRVDATFEAIADSEGYRQLNAGTFPGTSTQTSAQANQTSQPLAALKRSYQSIDDGMNQLLAGLSSTYPQRDQLKSLLRDQFVSVVKTLPNTSNSTEAEQGLDKDMSIDMDGFLPLSIRFDPETYYQNHPRVTGAYDGDYQSFQLRGKQDQAFDALLTFAQEHDITVVFVNLPLTNDYLDPVRLKSEQQFKQYMHANAVERELIFRDLSGLLSDKPDHFSDPSHLNRFGGYEVSNQLAKDPMIPWALFAGD